LQQLANAAGCDAADHVEGRLAVRRERAVARDRDDGGRGREHEIDKDPFGAWSVGASHANELIKGIATSANDALNSDNWAGAVSQIQAFQQALKDSNVPIDAQNTAMLRLSQAFLKQTGYYGLSIDSTSTT
jgi:hypothetical protein